MVKTRRKRLQRYRKELTRCLLRGDHHGPEVPARTAQSRKTEKQEIRK